MNYYDRRDSDNLIRLEIKTKKRAVELIEQLIPVIRKWDGKCLNKRFTEAMQEATGEHIIWGTRYNSWPEISWYPQERSVKSVNGEYNHNYITDIDVNLLCHMNMNEAISENKRINGDALLLSMSKRRRELEETIAELENGLTKVDEWIKRIEELEKQQEALKNEIPYAFQNYYYQIAKIRP